MPENCKTPLQGKLETIEFRVKLWLLIVSLATIAVLATAALRENVWADWHRIRSGYAAILADKATNEREELAADNFEIRISQNYVPDLRAVDRCTTCHSGIEDPRMADQKQPYTAHTGNYLAMHDPSKFGCTVCHEGQGRATVTADAHGEVPHWDYPLLHPEYVRSTCTKCHTDDDLHGENGLFEQAQGDGDSAAVAIAERGRRLAVSLGCQGCHVIDSNGGKLGRELSFIGDKTRHDFDFSHLAADTPRDVDVWLNQHFLAPSAVSPGSLMPAIDDPDDAVALTAYVLSLRTMEAGRYRRLPTGDASPDMESGAQLYARYCSACHGEDGRESNVPGLFTPALNNPDTLAVAGDDYLRQVIENGRSGTHMPAWGPGHGNLSRDEIDAIVTFIRGWEASGALTTDVGSRTGDSTRGRAYYLGRCAGCHGLDGEGGIGNALNSQTFLAIADNPFLAESIIHGRPGTAMPSWKGLRADAVSDIVSYLRSWQAQPPSFAEVTEARDALPDTDNARTGAMLYRHNCASCHGDDVLGGIGPSLASPSFLAAVDDEYLYRAIAEGRPSTAMPAWRHLSAPNVGALVAFLRSLAPPAKTVLRTDIPQGNYAVGEVFYKTSCAACHGDSAVGGVGPQLANPVFLSSVSDATLFEWIARGRAGTAMIGFSAASQGPTQLTDQQIADVIAYLRNVGTRGVLPVMRTGAGNARLGAQLFQGNCAPCHGADGEGASGPQLNNPAFLRTASDGFLAATIVLGRSGTAMLPMVAGSQGLGQIPPDNVADVIAFMRLWDSPTTWRKTRRVTEMSPRAIASGKRMYAQYCASCHGDDGHGVPGDAPGYAPALNNPEFLAAASDGFLLATIARGRTGTAMRSFATGANGMVSLDDQQMNDIVSFIRTWQ